MCVLFTIGHSNHPAELFLGLLRAHGVTAVADVRSKPYTKYAKHFCREPLSRFLEANAIRYVFLGDHIGGKPDAPELLGVDGKPDYTLIAASPAFAVGIDRLLNGLENHVIALMCGEEDPSSCHRHHLIVPALATRGVAVRHIRGDGSTLDAVALAKQAAIAAAPQRNTLFS